MKITKTYDFYHYDNHFDMFTELVNGLNASVTIDKPISFDKVLFHVTYSEYYFYQVENILEKYAI